MHHGGDNHPQCIMVGTITHNASWRVYRYNRRLNIYSVSLAVVPHSTSYSVSFSSAQSDVDVTQADGYMPGGLFRLFLPNFPQDRTGQDEVGCQQTDVNGPAVDRKNRTMQQRLQSQNTDTVTLRITHVWH